MSEETVAVSVHEIDTKFGQLLRPDAWVSQVRTVFPLTHALSCHGAHYRMLGSYTTIIMIVSSIKKIIDASLFSSWNKTTIGIKITHETMSDQYTKLDKQEYRRYQSIGKLNSNCLWIVKATIHTKWEITLKYSIRWKYKHTNTKKSLLLWWLK